jgi:HD-like signal output (HDOD) protein
MLTVDYIRDKVKTIINLPALPSIAMEIVEMVDNPRTSASQLGRVISSDQALTAKVLKIANSPFYGFPKKISTIDFAIIVLGFDALKEIVISLSLVSSLQKKSDAYFDSKIFWDHAISTGVIARKIARDLGYRVSGEVFVGGLLHDVGVSVIHRYFNGEFRRIVGIARESDLTFAEAEESVLGVTHAEIGSWLAERWNLPDHLAEAILCHNTPSKAEMNPELVSIIHCADNMAARISGETVEFDKGIEFEAGALERLQLSDPQVLDGFIKKYAEAVDTDIKEAVMINNSNVL